MVSPQDWNRYAYTINNPLKFIDPDGKDRIQIIVETYIPLRTITEGITGRTFGGNADREGYAPNVGDEFVEGTFKTQQTVVIETDPSRNGGNPVYGATEENPTGINVSIGMTHEYDKHGNEVGEAEQGSGKTLGGEVTRKDDGSTNVHVHGDEGIPKLSSAPGITFNYDIGVKTDKEGTTVTVSGQHDRFPTHIISAQNMDKPGSKPTVVYVHNAIKERNTPRDLSPVLRGQGQKKAPGEPVRIP